MTNPGLDPAYPDFDAGRSLPATGETWQAFKDVLGKLYGIAGKGHSRSVEADFSRPDSTDSIAVYCSESEQRDANCAEAETRFHHALVVSVAHGDRELVLGNGGHKLNEHDQALADEILNHFTSELDEPRAHWLRNAATNAQRANATLLPYIVDTLLERSPFQIHSQTAYTINSPRDDGSTIRGTWIEANPDYFYRWPVDEPIRTLNLTTADGTRFEYSSSVDQSERLLIQRPDGSWVRREVDPPAHSGPTAGHRLSVEVYGPLELLKSLQQLAADRRETRGLDADRITDGSLAEFTAALKTALDAGAATQAAYELK